MFYFNNNNVIVFSSFIISLNIIVFSYPSVDKDFNLVSGYCPPIKSRDVPQWMKDNTKSHNDLGKQKPSLESYDFVIVGAGAAGSVIASRLSEDPSVSILLIEAGGVENATTDTPAAAVNLIWGSRYDWNFTIEPQINLNIQTPAGNSIYTRGLALGGSSVLNGMIYIRGDPKAYDNWEQMGAKNWSWNEVFPYFLRSEGNADPKYSNSQYHNSCGPLTVSSNSENSPFLSAKYLVNACKELGFPQIDLNGPTIIGTGYTQQTICDGTRVSISKAFLEPVYKNRPNLHILTNSYVTKILFSRQKRAIGVIYNRNNKTYTAKANIEVILSAGVIKSPHILLLSGIGPKTQLNRFKIPVMSELPGVGRNLRDHIAGFIPNQSFLIPITGSIEETCDEYLKNRSGLLAHFDSAFCNVNSFINSDIDWHDLQISSVMSLPLLQDYRTKCQTFSIGAINVRPKSVGFLELRSSDPFDNPLIQPNYLTHSDDIIVLIDSIRWINRIAKTNILKNLDNHMIDKIFADCGVMFNINDKLYANINVSNNQLLECLAQHMTFMATLHAVGTCKMGSIFDNWSVVNPRLQVLGGIRGLRVADSSVMPCLPNANTYIASVMIGERAAQFIKDDYHLI